MDIEDFLPDKCKCKSIINSMFEVIYSNIFLDLHEHLASEELEVNICSGVCGLE